MELGYAGEGFLPALAVDLRAMIAGV